MAKVAVTYSPIVGGSTVLSLKKSFKDVNAEIYNADFRALMNDIPQNDFDNLYESAEGRAILFAHAKAKAQKFLSDNDIDCLALSGNSSTIDPWLYHQERTDNNKKFDRSRTLIELALTHVAIKRGMPILGICGGHQVIAVYGGGELTDLNEHQLEKQRLMDYDKILIQKDSILANIISKGEAKGVSTPYYEKECFGAHNEVVSEPANFTQRKAFSSNGETIEATETCHGAPIISTQFHPEIGAKGFLSSHLMYTLSEEDTLINLRIFDFFNKAGEAYKQKKAVMKQLKEQKNNKTTICLNHETKVNQDNKNNQIRKLQPQSQASNKTKFKVFQQLIAFITRIKCRGNKLLIAIKDLLRKFWASTRTKTSKRITKREIERIEQMQAAKQKKIQHHVDQQTKRFSIETNKQSVTANSVKESQHESPQVILRDRPAQLFWSNAKRFPASKENQVSNCPK